MEQQAYDMHWLQSNLKTEQITIPDDVREEHGINGQHTSDEPEYLIDDDADVTTEADIAQIAAQNLIFMAHDGQMEIISSRMASKSETYVLTSQVGKAVLQQFVEIGTLRNEEHSMNGVEYIEEYVETPQLVTEEVITDDWVQPQGEECVEISVDQIYANSARQSAEIEVPLPTVQDEYTALRPYPCDFCSRRFRKKASLMNHIISHQNDRPNHCKLCCSRFMRRVDLINHLKVHAEAPEDNSFTEFATDERELEQHTSQDNDHYYEHNWSINKSIPNKTISNMKNGLSGGSSSTSTAATAMRGRISRLKPKEEVYVIDDDDNEKVEDQFTQNQVQEVHKQEALSIDSNTPSGHMTDPNETSAEHQNYPIIDDTKPFVCQQCGLAFAREKALMSHLKNHRNKSPFECEQCNEMFWDPNSLHDHQKTHKFEESNSEYEPADSDGTPSEAESDFKFGEFYCSECGVSFHRRDLLRRHTYTHSQTIAHDDNDANDHHNCTTCGETFATPLGLLAHAEVHARFPLFKCMLCGESYLDENAIKRHLQSIHTGDMTANSCCLCGKACRDRKALIKHAWDHSREKCHSCSKCGKSFHNKARLKRHMTSHRDKTVICEVCNEEFPDGRTLSNHRHSHSTTSSGKLFPCNVCGKTFGSRSSQQIHVRIHTGERPYGCRYCWKAFADGGTLRKHERIHTGEKPYACAVCPRAFNQRVVLREHVRSHHSGLDPKRGGYFCNLCSTELASSGDLIQHLVTHSDLNTAKQRQPIPGPRKYKRRRKLKPHEIEHLRNMENKDSIDEESEVDMSEFDMANVDEYLGPKATPSAKNNKNIKVSKGKKSSTSQNLNRYKASKRNNSTTAGGRDADRIAERKRTQNNNDTDEHIWLTKLSTEETSKSLLSNVENTLQSIDTLVVGNTKNVVNRQEIRRQERKQQQQQVQQVHITKVEDVAYSPKPTKKSDRQTTKSSRARMIHTEKWQVPKSNGNKRRPKSSIVCTDRRNANSELTHGANSTSSTIISDDYEIITPDSKPPKQISCSPRRTDRDRDMQVHDMQMPNQILQTPHTQRYRDLYDAQLLLEASAIRKQHLEKYNPSIVNDLEDILRSPTKSDGSGRRRFTSESSAVFINDPSEGEHLIKIEPFSPDLREIVNASSAGSNSDTISRHNTRSSNSRRSTANSSTYLIYDVNETPPSGKSKGSIARKRNAAAKARTKLNNNNQNSTKTSPSSKPKSYLDFADNSFNTISATSSNTSSNTVNFSAVPESQLVGSQNSAVGSGDSMPPVRKQRVFECEMCSAVFPDRAQLLDHVPIHI